MKNLYKKKWFMYLNSAIGISSYAAVWYLYDWKLAGLLALMLITHGLDRDIKNHYNNK